MRSRKPYVRPLVALACALLAAPVAAADTPLVPLDCEAFLEAGGLGNRFRVIDPLSRVTACLMKEMLAEEEYRVLVLPRVELWRQLCYSDSEQAYLGGVVRRATLQVLAYATPENCASNLESLLALPEPQQPR